MKSGWVTPDWPAPANVEAWITTRTAGVSVAPWDSLNLGTHVGDSPAHVRRNRDILRTQLPDGLRLQWLNQVHGTRVVRVVSGDVDLRRKTADAAAVFNPGVAAVVMMADCLPVFFCDLDGSVAAAAHAGWRGLLAGVLESTINALDVPATQLMAWLGPAIAPCHFQVGDEVRTAFLEHPSACGSDSGSFESAFVPCADKSGKWMMDIYGIARLRLQLAGVSRVYGGGLCTVCDSKRFFSYRRDGVTGRMAGLIYLKP
ncbi:MAG: peptidoglycan editing factor PgeF [Pseudohongiella sp.]|nr:peptidoglycan editing factor PgeF [Pseudohongiella sp.]